MATLLLLPLCFYWFYLWFIISKGENGFNITPLLLVPTPNKKIKFAKKLTNE
jgi:hypothetical protein